MKRKKGKKIINKYIKSPILENFNRQQVKDTNPRVAKGGPVHPCMQQISHAAQ